MAEHGTRTMYGYGCRCDECCKAEHRQYLKRNQHRKRTYSKWGTDLIPKPVGPETQRRHNANRYREFKERPSAHDRPITWREIADKYNMLCVFCGQPVNPDDKWIGKNGRICYGRSYPTVDHIIPLNRGGTDTFDNVQLACKHCNSVKGARTWLTRV